MKNERMKLLYCLREALAQKKKRLGQIRGIALGITLMKLKDDDVTMEQAVVYFGEEFNITMAEAEEALRDKAA